MKINCLHCGHSFGVDEYTYQDYVGLLRCGTCGGLLDVRIEEGLIKACRPGSLTAPPAPVPAPQQQVQIPQHANQPVHAAVGAQSPASSPPEASPAQHEAEQRLDDIMRMADELTDNN